MSTATQESDIMFLVDEISGKLDAIKTNLLQQDPMLGTHLGAIHRSLQLHEELVHVLSDEQIQTYMAGMSKYKQIQIVNEASKARAPRKGKQTEDDF